MMATLPGRERAKSNPFWATSISRMQAGPARIVRGLYAMVQASPLLEKYLWFGSGWRTGSSEHQSGRAIDIIIVANTGMRPSSAERAAAMMLLQFLIANHRALGIEWIIFSVDGKNRPMSWNPTRGYWKALAPRGSVSGDHIDHLHVYFKQGADWPKSLSGAAVSAPGLPSAGDAPATSKEEDDMDANEKAMLTAVYENTAAAFGPLGGRKHLEEQGQTTARRVWKGTVVNRSGGAVEAIQELANVRTDTMAIRSELAALASSLGQIVSKGDVDMSEVKKAAQEAVAEGLQSQEEMLSVLFSELEMDLRLTVVEALEGKDLGIDPEEFVERALSKLKDTITEGLEASQ